ncbi:MAG: HPP family protein [Candidatus Eisenbacteria bacterium]|nr:HPP family protein [Candidatus Eisenbacteria bacterium]
MTRAPSGPPAPQGTPLFRLVALGSRMRFGYRVRSAGNRGTAILLFTFLSAATALAIITLAAYRTRFPLLFPPLGPSAFILFYAPLSASASPRSVVLAHGLSLFSGLAALAVVGALRPEAGLHNPLVMNGSRVAAIALAMGAAAAGMIVLRAAHPPAAATALLAAMGFMNEPVKSIGLLAAVLLLVAQAFLFNRVLGGLPYPIWRADPETIRGGGVLAGIPEEGTNFWSRRADRIFRSRRP